MKREEFKIDINANADKVWYALWDDIHYRDWCSVFCEGSYAVTDWKEGSKVHFLAPEGSGMYSEITKCVDKESMHFKHIGEIVDFEEQPLDENSSRWTGAQENYDLTHNDGITTLVISMDLVEDHLEYFKSTFPKGLTRLKEIAENLNITINCEVNASIDKVWDYWTKPEHIVNWNHASDDWCTTKATNNLIDGGEFSSTMAAKDGSVSFDFGGTHTRVVENELIESLLGDGRKMKVSFSNENGIVKVIETFDAENVFPPEYQKFGWQSILNNFKKYTEEY
jgi:uncharacterized protein YndB with AHSA1/START domain